MVLYVIAAALVALVILISVPVTERPAVLKVILRLVFVALISYFIVPPVFTFIAGCVAATVSEFGWKAVLSVAGIGVVAMAVLVAWRLDRKDNQAIRAGSTVAFEKRVRDLTTDLKYTHEEAVAAATRVRDGQ